MHVPSFSKKENRHVESNDRDMRLRQWRRRIGFTKAFGPLGAARFAWFWAVFTCLVCATNLLFWLLERDGIPGTARCSFP